MNGSCFIGGRIPSNWNFPAERTALPTIKRVCRKASRQTLMFLFLWNLFHFYFAEEPISRSLSIAAATHRERKHCSLELERDSMATGTRVPARTPQEFT